MQVQCECGRNHYRLTGEPMCRFICHCTVCQAYTGARSADVMVLRARDVQLDDIGATRFKRWRKPPNIRRGSCVQCGKPVIEYGLFGQLVFVPTPNVADQGTLPPAALHLFYDRARADVQDTVPKLSGYIASLAGLLRLIMRRV